MWKFTRKIQYLVKLPSLQFCHLGQTSHWSLDQFSGLHKIAVVILRALCFVILGIRLSACRKLYSSASLVLVKWYLFTPGENQAAMYKPTWVRTKGFHNPEFAKQKALCVAQRTLDLNYLMQSEHSWLHRLWSLYFWLAKLRRLTDLWEESLLIILRRDSTHI